MVHQQHFTISWQESCYQFPTYCSGSMCICVFVYLYVYVYFQHIPFQWKWESVMFTLPFFLFHVRSLWAEGREHSVQFWRKNIIVWNQICCACHPQQHHVLSELYIFKRFKYLFSQSARVHWNQLVVWGTSYAADVPASNILILGRDDIPDSPGSYHDPTGRRNFWLTEQGKTTGQGFIMKVNTCPRVQILNPKNVMNVDTCPRVIANQKSKFQKFCNFKFKK